jgi:SSS family solute:Na+ symporter
MSAIDWAIITTYFALVLVLGWWHRRRNVTEDDFWLGGRRCRSLPVGLSLMVSWFSVISYLAWPGEIVAYGPMLLVGVLAAPVTLGILAWVVIPKITRAPVQWWRNSEWHTVGNRRREITSAYQLLHDIGCRRLGAFLFVCLRLAWMSTIVYIASAVVVAPLVGVPPWLVAAVLVGVTIIYTLGGFRAVVWTDVIQAGLMFGGAILTLWILREGVMQYATGPGQTHERFGYVAWPAPIWSFNWCERVTVPTAILSAICLGLCVRSGDQIAVQRYLSVPSVRAARRVLWLSWVCDLVLTGLLCAVGFALVFSGSFPGVEPDRLFPSFIASGLPVGVTGAVVAALLAAAMSSLSSGFNSCLLTWEKDLRWGRRYAVSVIADESAKVAHTPGRQNLCPARPVPMQRSWDQVKNPGVIRPALTVFLSLIVLSLAALIGTTDTGLIELCYKVVNLLAIPLGGLMLVALFLPCRPWAAWVGCLGCIATVVYINYWSPFSFLAGAPLGLAIQLLIGGLSWNCRYRT